MNEIDSKVTQVRALILDCLSFPLSKIGIDTDSVPDDLDLMDSGVIDSLGFIDLLEVLEDRLGIEIDMTEFSDAGLTTVGGLSRQVAGIAK